MYIAFSYIDLHDTDRECSVRVNDSQPIKLALEHLY